LHGFLESEDFVAITSDPDLISLLESQLALPEEERFLHINGLISASNGCHNHDWSWHFTYGDWSLAEMSIELCDGIPSMVEADTSYWLNTVGYFCPWSSYVLREITPCRFTEDIDHSGDESLIDIADLVYFVNFMFKDGPTPPCITEVDIADLNCDGINISDLVFLVNFMFKNGPAPPSCWDLLAY